MGAVNVRLYEREAAAEAVRLLLDAASAGRGGTVFVMAPAGLGKTSVLHMAVAEAQGRFEVRMGGGDAVEAALPYGLIGQVLGDDDELPAPEVLGDLPAANRFYLTLRRIRRAAADRPLLLALDDLHWADPDSLAFLHLLCRRAPELPLAIVATARPWPDPALRAAEQLAARGLAVIQRLAPLTDPAARDLLRDHFGDIDGDEADRVVAACDGNPLLLELAGPNLVAGHPDLASGPAGAEATRLLLARFSASDSTAQRYVRAASVLGTRFRPSVAAAMADLPAEHAAGTVEALFRADLFRGDDAEWVRFRHALIRQAIYDDIVPPARAYLHERAFRTLLIAGVPIGEAAEHAIAAGLSGDAQAIEALTGAGRAALRAGAVQAARRYLDAAVGLAGDNAPVALQIDLAKALLAGGAAEAAAALLDRILARPGLPALTQLSAQLLLGKAAFHSGAVRRAGELFDTVAAASGDTDPEVALSALLDHTLQSWARLGPRAALPVAVRARGLAADVGRYQQACAEAAWALCAWLSGDPAGLGAAEKAASGPAPVASAASTGHWGLDPAAVPADIAVWAERFPLAERLLADALRIADERAEPFLLFHAALSRSDMFCRLGRLGEALDMADRACDVGELLPVGLPLARAARGLALMEAGQLAEAAACEDSDVGPEWYLAAGYQLRLRATLAYRQGRIDDACSAFDLLEQRTGEWGIADPSHIPFAADAIAAYFAAGRPSDARQVVDRLANCPLPTRWPAATAAAGQAALAAHDGDLETAEAGLAQAVQLLEPVPMPLARCRTLTAYGAVLARLGRRDKARQLLTDALQHARGCGAGWHADQALTELRRAGGRAGRIPPGQLSPQEKAVARLARAGRTNRQISRELYLSVNTVETHLAHAYRKLGIGRRGELAGQELD
jgi:DNA-binding CsgD family transcriptional regulator